MEQPPESMDIEPEEENCAANLSESSEKTKIKEQLDIEDSLLVPAAVEIPVDGHNTTGKLDEAKLYRCNVCDKAFTRRAHLSRHSRLHSGEKPYACLICNIRFHRSEPRNLHMNKKHPEFRSESCTVCGKAFIDENDRIEHTRSHLIKRSFRCTVCSKEFEKASSLAGHMQIHSGHESSGRRVHKCGTCQMEFNRFDHLIRHQTVHSGLKLFQCKLCFKRFTRADNRKKHESTCKGDSTSTDCENGVDQCDDDPDDTQNETDPLEIINVSSILEQDFEDIETSSNAIDFFEDIKFFAENGGHGDGDDDEDSILNGTKLSLNDSARMSQLEADFDLEKLGGIRQKVPRPKLTQEEIDTLTCSICSKTLAQKYHLVRHKITHLGDLKPYKCTLCNKTFSRREHLKPHLLTHRRQSEKMFKLKAKPNKIPHFKPFATPPAATNIKPTTTKLQSNSLRSQLLQRFKVFAIKLKQKSPPDYYEQCFDFMGNLFLSNLQSLNSETFSSKRNTPTTILPKLLQPRKIDDIKPTALLPTKSTPTGVDSTRMITRVPKIHTCDVCARTFTRAEHKRRHMAIHLNSTPYNCEICQRKFSRSDHMVQHFRVHHADIKPYKCKYSNCFERFESYKEKLEHGRNCTLFFTTPSTSTGAKAETSANGVDANGLRYLMSGGGGGGGGSADPSFHDEHFANNDAAAVSNFQTHFIKMENEYPADDGYDPIYGY